MSSSTLTVVPAAQPVTKDASAGTVGSTTVTRVWLSAAMVYVVVRALPILSYPSGRDQSTYLLIGRSLLEGKQLYRDLWDNKPPGIFFLYAGISKLFGTALWGVALVDILWLLAISYCIFRFTARFTIRTRCPQASRGSWHPQTACRRLVHVVHLAHQFCLSHRAWCGQGTSGRSWPHGGQHARHDAAPRG